MYEIPGVVRLDHVRERRHGRAVQAGHEDLVDILVGVAALEARVTLSRGEIVGTNRLILAVGEGRGRRTVALPMRTMTLPAFELGEERFAVGNTLHGDRRLGRNLDRVAGFFLLPTGREDLDVGHQIGALLFGEGTPDRHVGVGEAARDGVEDIFIGGQRAGKSGAALESRNGEVARLRIKPNRVLAIGISIVAVTAGTIAAVVGLRGSGMPGDIADVALHGLDHKTRLPAPGGYVLGR